jgi:uncharacterized protein (TIGR03000 family)
MAYLLASLCVVATAIACAEEAPPPDKALILVKLPASAKLTIGSSGTAQTGTERTFVSPTLPAGKTLSYTLTATWTDNGKPRTEVRTAQVTAGQRTVVDFNVPEKSQPGVGTIPEDLLPPKGQALLFKARAKGVQIYECKAKAGKTDEYEWVLKAPEADLFDERGEKIGKHYAGPGPTWEANDGSKVVGKKLAGHAAPGGDAIPWLLLEAKPEQEKGVLGKVTYIQRVDTRGGLAPAEGADKDHAGKEARVSYEATYAFYGAAPESATEKAEPKSRTFLFTYGATVTGLPPGKTARIWLPVPPSNEDQDVQIVEQTLPAEGKISTEPKFGNQIFYVEAKAGDDGTVPVKVTYRVRRKEVIGKESTRITDEDKLPRYLVADARVPIEGKPLDLLKGKELPGDQMAAARILYDVVNGHMRYSKEGTGWGRGDSVWACENGYGNCSDFHSLFISLARAKKIPAKFEIGFPLPDKRGSGEIPGYHCWAKFKPDGRGWVPVDISEANKDPKMTEYFFGNLTENRVAFSTGRDLELVPKQDGELINFLVYPYVEVDGKPYAAEKVQRKFCFEDVK